MATEAGLLPRTGSVRAAPLEPDCEYDDEHDGLSAGLSALFQAEFDSTG
jgi:hypothetical protein